MILDMPSNFPPFLREGYGIEYQDDVSRTVMSTGRSRIRRDFESVPGLIKVYALLDDSQAQAFEAWYLYALESSDWFNAMLKTPLGYEQVVVRFTKIYEGPSLIECLWKYTFSLEMQDEQVVTESDYNAL